MKKQKDDQDKDCNLLKMKSGNAIHKKKTQIKKMLTITCRGKTKHLYKPLEEGHYTIFDIETTGGNPERNGITEIFAISFKNQRVCDTFYSMVNPMVPIPPIVRRMTGISNRMVKNAPLIWKVMPKFVDFIGDSVLVSHNTIGDMKFLRYFSKLTTGKMISNYYLCTHLLAEKLVREAPNKSLKGLAEFFDILGDSSCHRAEDDACLTLRLFEILVAKLQEKKVDKIVTAIKFQQDYESSIRLGWGIRNRSLQGLSNGPGVFFLSDHNDRILFLSSTTNVANEVNRLKNFTGLSKKVLRIIVNADKIGVKEFPHLCEAMLAEAQELGRQQVPFNPALWHQRVANFLYLSRDGAGKPFLAIGPLTEGVILAFGPIMDFKEAGIYFENIAKIIGVEPKKQSIYLSKFVFKILKGYLLSKFFHNGSSFRFLMRNIFSFQWYNNLRLMRQLNRISVPKGIKELSFLSGVIAQRNSSQSNNYDIYSILGGELFDKINLQDVEQEDIIGQCINNDLYQKLSNHQGQIRNRPLSKHRCYQINRLVWLLYHGGVNGNKKTIILDRVNTKANALI